MGGTPVEGKVALVLDGLPRGGSLRSNLGFIQRLGLQGRPVVVLDLPADTYESFEGLTLVLEFRNSRQRKLHYTLKVLADSSHEAGK